MKKTTTVLLAALILCGAALGTWASGQKEEEKAKGPAIKGNLEVYVFSGPIKKEFWDEAVAEFTARYPEVNVKLVAIAKIHDQVRPKIVAGDPPDLYFNAGAGRIMVEQLYEEKLALQLDDLLNEKNWEGTKRFRDTILSYRFNVLEGKTWGIQLPFHLIGFYYHEPSLKKLGITAPQDFPEFMEYGAKLHGQGVAPMVTTGIYPYYFTHFVMRGAVAAAGGKQAFIDWKELKPGFFTSSVFKDVIRKYEEVIKKGYLLKGSEGMNHTESQLQWIQDKAAFVTSGTWIESEMSKDFPAGYTEGIRFTPSFFVDKGVQRVISPYGDASMVIFKGKNEAAAKEFLKALYSIKIMASMTELTNILSNVPEANAQAKKSPAIQSAMAWMDKLPQIAWPEGGYITAEVDNTLSAKLQALMTGQISTDELAAAVEASAEKVRNDKSVTFLKAYFPE